MEEIKLYKSFRKTLAIFFYIALGSAFGIVIAITSEGQIERFSGLTIAIICSLAILIGCFQLLDRQPQIIINQSGIWDKTSNEDMIRWEQIKDAYIYRMNSSTFIPLVLNDSFKYKHQKYMWTTVFSHYIGLQRMNLSLMYLKVNENILLELIHEMIISPQEERETIIKKYNTVISNSGG